MPVTKRGQGEEGFTMIVTVIAMSVLAMLVLVAVTAVNGDAHLTSRDLMRKQAYEAAKAGIDEYAFRLHTYTGYWSKCDQVEGSSAVNQMGSTAKRRSVPGMPSAQYAIELIPADDNGKCDPTNLSTATASMLQSVDPMKGTFRIRSNGYAGQSHVAITATFKPASFLDYVYFTQYETSDPVSYATEELKYGAEQQCEKFIRDKRTETALKNKAGQTMNTAGGVYKGENGESRKYCTTISFVSGDNIKGPMHTNDAFVICNNPNAPKLGRGIADPIEVGAGSPGWYSTRESFLNSGSNCSGNPEIKGQFRLNSSVIIPPETNSELSTIAEPTYRFSGEVSICLSGATMTVGKGKTCNEQTLPFPTNGVIYVSSIKCSGLYTPFSVAYTSAVSECGNVNLSGTYSKPLTIAAANDVVITGNVTKTSEEGLLGLIANNFIRIYHPVKLVHPEVCEVVLGIKKCHEDLLAWECGGSNEPGYVKDINIEAALLAIKHSFIVDNYDCGGSLGSLNVKGAIAQKFRGAVGTTGGTGYIKNYEYDERLKTTEPPSFIQPVKSDWVIGRETTE
jgi:type II secretory pathway pseudopilin PulG